MFNRIEYDKKYRKEHKEERKKNWERWSLEHKKEREEYKKQYRSEHCDKEYQKQYYLEKYKNSLEYQINRNLRRAIGLSLRGNKAGRHWETLVGYTLKNLIKRLKNTIPKGYTWQDYLNGKLELDHIVPISAFNYTKISDPDFKRCWALDNLQLLSTEGNRKKGTKLLKPFQPALKL